MKKLGLVIDPGHYPGYNPGVINGIFEGNVMYQLAEAEKKYCDANYSQYVDCILTRSFDEDPSLELGRGRKAVDMKLSGKYEKVMFMSDHTNATGGTPPDPKVTGVTVFTTQFRKNTYGFLRSLADCVAKVMNSHFLYMDAKPLSTSDSGDWWGVVRGAMDHAKTQAEADKRGVDYAFIMEHGFHTNPTECAFFGNEENIKRMAQAKIDFIVDALGIVKTNGVVKKEIIDGTLTVTYKGSDGVNLHTTASYSSSNIKGALHYGEKRRAVNKLTLQDGTTMYRLEEGEYITTHANYVSYVKNPENKFVVEVNSSDGLNVRDFPNAAEGTRIFTLSNTNLADKVGEAYNKGNKWYLLHIKNKEVDITGFASADYLKKRA